jgi:TPR repeat protein
MYEEGRGVSRDSDRAKQLYRRACDIGNNAACRLPLIDDGRVIVSP